MPKRKKKTSDAVEILHRRYYQGKPDRISQLEETSLRNRLVSKADRESQRVFDAADNRGNCPRGKTNG